MSYTKMESNLYENTTFHNLNGNDYLVISILDEKSKAAFIKDIKNGSFYVAEGIEQYLKTDEKGSVIGCEWAYSTYYGNNLSKINFKEIFEKYNKEEKITMFRDEKEFVSWLDTTNEKGKLSVEEAEVIFNYMQGHDYTLGIKNDKLIRIDLNSGHNEEYDEFSVDETIDIVCEWNYEIKEETMNKIEFPNTFLEFKQNSEKLEALEKDSLLLDEMFKKTKYGEHLNEVAKEVVKNAAPKIKEILTREPQMVIIKEEKEKKELNFEMNIDGEKDVIPVKLNIASYANNDNLYIGLLSNEEGYDEPFSDVTVNLDKTTDYCGYLDEANNPDLKKFIEENGIGELFPGMEKQSGFNTYSLYLFDRDKLEELDPKGLESYENKLEKTNIKKR